ncbi:MAG: hypothetical protein LBH92_04985 [Bacteroidales bacterium]|jgi:cell fate regulator YaaT (PSP1 superfamily)|nr:hypothetical protein [Bacteroidales bacterium]
MSDNILEENKKETEEIKSLNSNTNNSCKTPTRCVQCQDAYDWLKDIPLSEDKQPFYIAEVRFKNDHRGFYTYTPDLHLEEGDIVAVESDQGHDIGTVVLTGEIVRFQMKRKGVLNLENCKKVYRKARLQDIEKWIQSVDREHKTLIQARQIIDDLELDMKLNDLEFRGDGTKAIFYYTANDRIDFRELIKILAERFKIKIEMRQIGMRQEAAKVGGIGSCGREMCCCRWMSTFQSVSTQSARLQQLPLNPQKLAGQCGKLKCCLNYEQDIYADAHRYFPDPSIRLKTKQGTAYFVKSDVLKKLLYYSYSGEQSALPYVAITANGAWEIIKMNEKNQFPEKLEDFTPDNLETDEKVNFEQHVNQDDLTRFDRPHQQHRQKKNDHNKRNRGRNQNPPQNKK